MYDKTNVALFPILSSNNSITILLNNSASSKSSKVSSKGLFPKTFVRPVNSCWHFQIHLKVRKYKDQTFFF